MKKIFVLIFLLASVTVFSQNVVKLRGGTTIAYGGLTLADTSYIFTLDNRPIIDWSIVMSWSGAVVGDGSAKLYVSNDKIRWSEYPLLDSIPITGTCTDPPGWADYGWAYQYGKVTFADGTIVAPPKIVLTINFNEYR